MNYLIHNQSLRCTKYLGSWVSLSLRSKPSIWNTGQQQKHHLAGPTLCYIKLLSIILFFSEKKSQILNCWIQCKLFSLKLLKALNEVAPNLYWLLSSYSQIKCLASAGFLFVATPCSYSFWVPYLGHQSVSLYGNSTHYWRPSSNLNSPGPHQLICT